MAKIAHDEHPSGGKGEHMKLVRFRALVAACTIGLVGLGGIVTATTASAHTTQGSATPGNDSSHPWPSNGCGSVGTAFVPDSLPGIFNFNHACDHHDGCYGGFAINYWVSRSQCDIWFFYDMQASCRWQHGANPSATWAGRRCLELASGYYSAVRSFGRSSYKGPASLNN